jgi:hypothetical protein
LLDATFEQEYAFALPIDDPLGNSINIAALEAIQSVWGQKTTFRCFGRNDWFVKHFRTSAKQSVINFNSGR